VGVEIDSTTDQASAEVAQDMAERVATERDGPDDTAIAEKASETK
jgi:hypothetical protein